MPFFSGATDMDALIDLIADQLIATGAWGTADATLVAGAHPAKRAIQHLTDPNFCVMFDRNLINPNGSNGMNEIRVQISTGFNATTHVPSGTIQTTGIPAETGVNGGPGIFSNNKLGSFWAWIDEFGVTMIASWAMATTITDWTVFFTLERNTSKEYADGLTNFFCASIPTFNHSVGVVGQYYVSTNNRAMITRPFSFQEFTSDANSLEKFFGAYRSPGNSKVYFEFPFFSNNQLPTQRSMIAQTQRFFWVQPPGGGLADGDLITYVQGAETLTYLVKMMQSPDHTNYAPWAIRQA